MKSRLFALTRTPVFERFIMLLDRLDRERQDLLRVLTYHRVDEPENRRHLSPALLSATPKDFEQQMAFVRRYYTPISVYQVLDYYDNGVPLPPRSLLVTVDDAYRDFDEHIWPIARRYDIPLTLFVPTDYPDNPDLTLWWDTLYNALQITEVEHAQTPLGMMRFSSSSDRLAAFKKLRDHVKSLPHYEALNWVQSFTETLQVPPRGENSILNWDSLRKLAHDGVTLAAHTRTHPMLNRIGLDAVRTEARQSLEDLKREIGMVPPIFAYPSGGVSDSVIQAIEQEGFKVAFTTQRGVNNLKKQNPLRLKRINVGRSTTTAMLRAQCLPTVAALRGS